VFVHMDFVDANVHILNSILRKFFIDTFSDTPFFMRLNSLLAQVLFLCFLFRLCKKCIKNEWWMAGIFVLVNLNPYLFDFWGLSRGYALAIAFMTMSVYYFLSYTDNRRVLYLYLALTAGVLSVYSNFTLLEVYASLVGLVLFNSITSGVGAAKEILLKELPAITIVSFILYRLVAMPIKKLQDAHRLYHGGDTGFYHDTIRSVIKNSLYLPEESTSLVIKYLSIAILLIVLLSGIYWAAMMIKSKKDRSTKTGLLLWLMMTLPAIATVVQHKFMGTKYLTDRMALFMTVLFMLQLGYWLYHASNILPRLTTALFILAISLVTVNFIKNLSLNGTLEWWFNKNDMVVLNRIANECKGKKEKIKLRVFWLSAPPMGYDTKRMFTGRFEDIAYNQFPADSDTTFDYYYMPPEYLKNISTRYKIDTMLFDGKYLLMKKMDKEH